MLLRSFLCICLHCNFKYIQKKVFFCECIRVMGNWVGNDTICLTAPTYSSLTTKPISHTYYFRWFVQWLQSMSDDSARCGAAVAKSSTSSCGRSRGVAPPARRDKCTRVLLLKRYGFIKLMNVRVKYKYAISSVVSDMTGDHGSGSWRCGCYTTPVWCGSSPLPGVRLDRIILLIPTFVYVMRFYTMEFYIVE